MVLVMEVIRQVDLVEQILDLEQADKQIKKEVFPLLDLVLQSEVDLV
jgi:hypothetical protein